MPLLLAGLAPASPAHAGAGDVARLEYSRSERAATCPDRDVLENAVRARLGYSPFFPGAHRTVVVELTDVSAGLRGRMRLLDADGVIVGSRELVESVEHCEELVTSLALAISIALDPTASADPPAQPAEAPPSSSVQAPVENREEAVLQPAPPSVRPAASARPAVTPPAKPSLPSESWAIRGAAFAALNAAPAVALGFRVGASWRRGYFLLSAEFVDQLSATKTVEHVGGARVALISGTLAPCVVKAWLAGCALLSVGSLHAEGLGILDTREERRLNAALGARLEFTPALFGPVHLLANVDVATSLTPVTLRVHGQKIWETPSIAPALGLGLKWAIP